MTPIFRRLRLALPPSIAAPALAQGFEDLDALESRVVAALGAGDRRAGRAGAPIDRRLRLAACPEPVDGRARRRWARSRCAASRSAGASACR